jgi:hypothetical protein
MAFTTTDLRFFYILFGLYAVGIDLDLLWEKREGARQPGN